MRSARYIWVDRHGKNELIVFTIEVVKMVAPNVLDVSSVDKTMAVGCCLDKHHWRQVIQIPIRRNLNQACVGPHLKGFHPRLGILGIVNFGPRCSHRQIVGLAVVMAHAAIVLDSIVQQKLGTFAAGFPPITASKKKKKKIPNHGQGLYDKSFKLTMVQRCPWAVCR